MTELIDLFKTKKCGGCQTVKEVASGFWKGQTICIDCSKDRQKNRWNSRTPKKRLEQHLKYKYSLTIAELNDALQKQKGGCAICEEMLPDLLVYNNRRRGYAIDHNHETGEFRGILCLKCNSMLGMACDNHILLEKASQYLKERGSYHKMIAARAGKGK
jgi:hypothetical protein